MAEAFAMLLGVFGVVCLGMFTVDAYKYGDKYTYKSGCFNKHRK